MTVGGAQGLWPGARFGRYRIEALVASGGMAIVYRATDLELERRVALKLIAPQMASEERFRERFKRESRLAAALDHPHVIPVYEAGERDGVLYIAMRFVEGIDLQAHIRGRGGLAPRLAARITGQLASALDAAHSAGLVHRDIKPSNVLLAGGAGEEHPYLTDFGIAKRLHTDAGVTATGRWLGTLDYVAPEQVSGEAVDARADVYALACLLFEALTAEVPYPRETEPAKLVAKIHDPPPSLGERAPGLPRELEAVIARGMARAPEERYPSAGDLGRAALAAVEGSSPATPEQTVAAGAAAPAASPAASTAPPRDETIAPAPAASTAPPRDETIAPAPVATGSGPSPQPPPPTPSTRRRPSLRPAAVAALLVGVLTAALVFLVVAGVLGGGEGPAPGGSGVPGPGEERDLRMEVRDLQLPVEPAPGQGR